MSLFGIDIASVVSDAVSGAGGLKQVVVTRVSQGTRDPDDITAGRQGATITTITQGFVESASEFAKQASSVQHEATGLLIAKPMSFRPAPGDTVLCDGRTWTIVGPVKTDPAGASHEIMLR